jgi:hypothetical protein
MIKLSVQKEKGEIYDWPFFPGTFFHNGSQNAFGDGGDGVTAEMTARKSGCQPSPFYSLSERSPPCWPCVAE